MNAPAPGDLTRPPLTEQRLPDDLFDRMRGENLARWPTGAEVDIDAAAEVHRRLPRHKQLAWVMRKAVAEHRCLTQPRGGFGTFAMHRDLMVTLDREGHADIVPTTTDSYTRNEQWHLAQQGIEESERLGRSMLNGYPMVNYGVARAKELIDAIDKPAIMLTGTSMPKLTGEIAFAGGYSISAGTFTTSYTKENVDETASATLPRSSGGPYYERGIELHRRQPGFYRNYRSAIDAIICTGLPLAAAWSQELRN
jgi:methylaspartate mutase epsilon subunit